LTRNTVLLTPLCQQVSIDGARAFRGQEARNFQLERDVRPGPEMLRLGCKSEVTGQLVGPQPTSFDRVSERAIEGTDAAVGTAATVPRFFYGAPSMEGMMSNWTNAKLCDVANLILGAFLFLSPWIVGFSGTAAGNANIAGIVIAALAIAALAAFAVWEEWLNLIVGLWTLVSPWVLSFHAEAKAMTVCVIVGILVAVLAAVELWIMSQSPPRLTAGR
jgi:SPW repeat-containing protein